MLGESLKIEILLLLAKRRVIPEDRLYASQE